jgi:MYXO-CTERM domain-containing protein
MPDNDGWLVARLYAGLRLADVTGDGRADVCARDGAGLSCWVSNGTGFATKLTGPLWAGLGWENPSVWGTLMIAGPRCIPSPEICNGKDDDCNGIIDDGCDADAGLPDSGGGGSGWAGANSGATGGTGGGSPNLTGDAGDDGGCACRAAPRGGARWLGAALLAVLLLAGRRQSRPRRARA